MAESKKKLTDKQRIFCKEYIIDLNASASAIRAGYSKATAGAMGHENLKKPEIKEEITRLMKERSKKTEVSAERIVQELASLGLTEKSKFGEFDLDAKDKLKALEMLARHVGAFNNDESGKSIIKVNIKKPGE